MSSHLVVVLLVQPERDDREMYAEFLRYRGFQPISVATAAEALTIAPSADIIVTAMLLPGPMDGVELITCLRHDQRTEPIPVVVLTACAWQSDRNRAVAAGCDVFLAKPCLPEVLVSEMNRVLAIKHMPKPDSAAARSARELGADFKE